MKKTLLSLALALASTLAIQAQEADTSRYDLPEVVLTASKIDLNEKEVARHLIRVSGEELRSNAISFNEGLEHLGSIDVRQRSPFDVQADLGIRGGTFDQSLILIDGIPLMDPQTGHHNLNLPLPLDQVERVEILTGGSRFFGPQAFSGAVNLITNSKRGNYTNLRFTGVQYALVSGGFDQGVALGDNQLILSYTGTRSDGFTDNTDFTNQQVSAKFLMPTKSGELAVQGGWNGKAFGASTFYSVNFPNQFEQTQSLFGAVRYRTQVGNWNMRGYAMVRRHFDRFELFRESFEDIDVPSWYTKHNYHRTDVIGGEWAATYDYGNGQKTNIALNGRTENIVSNNLGDSLVDPIEVPEGDEFYYLGRRRQNYSLNLEHHITTGNWSITGGALFNQHSDFGFDLLPGIDIAYSLNDRHRLFTGANRSFRTPTYTDLYYRLGGAQGSADLRPEYAWNYELGWAGRIGKDRPIDLKAVVFYRQGTDLIDWIFYSADSIVAANLTEIDLYGLEIDGVWRGAADAFLREVRLSYTFMDGDKADGINSLYVLDNLRHTIGLGIEPKLVWRLTARWDASLQDRAWSQDLTGSEIENPVTLLNLRINADLGALNAYIAASNLLDQTYEDRLGVPQPGIWIYGGATFTIDY